MAQHEISLREEEADKIKQEAAAQIWILRQAAAETKYLYSTWPVECALRGVWLRQGAAFQICQKLPNVLVSQKLLVFTKKTQRIWNGAQRPD